MILLLQLVLQLVMVLQGQVKLLVDLFQRIDLLLALVLVLLQIVLVRTLLLVEFLFEQLLHVEELLRDGRELLFELVDGLRGFGLRQIVFLAQKIDARVATKTQRFQFILVALYLIGVITIGMTEFVADLLQLNDAAAHKDFSPTMMSSPSSAVISTAEMIGVSYPCPVR